MCSLKPPRRARGLTDTMEPLRAAAAVAAVAGAAAALSVMCGKNAAFRVEPEPELQPEAEPAAAGPPPAGEAEPEQALVQQPHEPPQMPEAATPRPNWPPPMPLPGVEVGSLPCRGEHADVASAARTFNELGLCIAESLLPPEFAAECCVHAQEAFDDLMREVAARGIVLGEKTKGGFREIVKRTSGRYEMLYRMDEGIFENALGGNGKLARALAETWLTPFLDATMGSDWRLMRQALLVSFPGSTEQQWHVDGDHLSRERHLPCHAMNVFIALDEITQEMGPTELRPASQFLTRDLKRQLLLAKIKKRLHSTVQPGFKPGDACLFDYRTLHRGMPNVSDAADVAAGDRCDWQDGMLWGSRTTQRWNGKARPMLELTFASSRYNDLLNFPPRSIFDSEPLRSST